ncbi:MAG: hypothetical protein A3G34_05430 [Candidatus Lindowbacteria bacterium RIFCSPLOWO2_12_FULL_62_27]|nr:MAG: hypothetical protein A3G34_05430 [Candidatus Lindowbacteria bacterium RIFCSPLOWO2_12_FULL_62_27]OGH63753.1 MAG: hypothetical protein A3I06_10665 [Candidatus Lindowbacteria bacterium RIFCSPLOWO2_02_FULL_62_12]
MNLNVLVVDDEADVCEVLKDGLKVHGIGVTIARDGKEAVLQALVKAPDAVLMDILMPGLAGLDALGLFKIIEPIRTVPVIMLTALKSKEDILNAMRAGAADYIGKPFDIADTVTRLRRVVARPAPMTFPVFRYLSYRAGSDGRGLRLELEGDFSEDAAEDLEVLIRALLPLQPVRIDLDFEKVPNIGDRLVPNLVAVRDMAAARGGKVLVANLDPKKYRAAAVSPIRNIFPAVPAPPEEPVRSTRASKKVDAVAKDIDEQMSQVLSRLPGLRFDFKLRNELSVLELQGQLTGDTRSEVEKAFQAVTEAHAHVMVVIEKASQFDARGMLHLVEKITDTKNREGLKVYVVCRNQELQVAYRNARGHLVAGIYDDRDKALSSFRASG